MKLGDDMTTMKTCHSWSDVRPRKIRPPRIGDIPRHSAVDEESPNLTSYLQVRPSPEELSSLERNKTPHCDVQVNVTQKLLSSSLSSINIAETQQQPSTSPSLSPPRNILPKLVDKPKTVVGISKVEPPSSIANKIRVSRTTSHDSNVIHGTVVSTLLSVTEKLSSIINNINESFRQEPKSNSFVSSVRSVDNNTELRRDSAVCLEDNEESNEVDAEISEKLTILNQSPDLFSSAINQKNPSAYGISCPSKENTISVDNDDVRISRYSLAKYYRPRRESSGYFSNLSTFDDDRRNSTVETLYNLVTSRDRRRSSTKRLNLGRFTRDEGDNERMPSTEIFRKVSTAGLEMPNIEELKEIRDDAENSCLSSNDDLMDSSRVKMLPDSGTITGKDVKVSDQYSDDGLKNRNISRTMCEAEEIGKITTGIGQATLTGEESHETHDKSFSMILTPSQEAFTDIESCTILDSCQDGRGNYKEPPSPRRSMTPVKPESCVNESSTKPQMSSPRSQRQRKRMIHSYSSTSSSNSELERILEKPQDTRTDLNIPIEVVDDNDDVIVANTSNDDVNSETIRKILPKSVKLYQLMSTQSEDRGDDEPRLTDRRISLQINRNEDIENQPCATASTFVPEEKSLFHCATAPSLQIPTCSGVGDSAGGEKLKVNRISALPKITSSGEVCTHQKFMGDNGTVGIRPIYPYCHYSPYGSPQGSPRARRRPLRESRRVSVDNRQGALQLNQYKLFDNIGQGSFGIVKLAYNEEDGIHYAMKILSKKKLMKKAGIFGRMAPGRKGAANPLAKVYREIALLKKLDHPNVVKLVEVLDDPDEDNLYLVFELIEKGEVLQLPTDNPLDEETARKNFRDVVLGVEYLHYQRIVHRDIKPSNLLVDSEGQVKVADLGVSAELRVAGELLSGSAGTPAFAAPETTILGAQYSGTLCDVWSMGVTLYSLVTGRVPWDGAGNIIGVQAAVRTEPLRFPEQPELSANLRHLISRMLDKDPTTRMNLHEIKEHCWLTNDGKDPLPSETDNCRLPVTVTDEEVARVVTRVPKLDTLILIKTMLKQHSFQNPFLPKKIEKPICGETISNSISDSKRTQPTGDRDDAQTTIADLAKNKTKQFHRAGRSNSAPDSYEWQTNGRQVSVDTTLPPVTEATVQESENDKR